MNVHESLRWLLSLGLGAALAAAAAAPAAAPVQTSLPVPPGPHSVGTRLFHWADGDRPEIVTPEPEDRREIVVQLWYPSRPVAAARPAPYVPEMEALEEILGPEASGVYAAVGTNSILDAPPLSDVAAMPLILFSHGLGQTRWSYTALAEGLASRGWLVAAVQHPGGALATVRSDGTVVPMAPFWEENSPPEVPVEEVFRRTDRRLEHWADDLSFALDRLERLHGEAGDFQGLVDLESVGVAGHSIGGKAAVAACMRDARFGACANLDGWPIHSYAEVNGLDQPYLYVEDLRTLTDEELEAFGATIQEYARNMRDLDERKERIFEAMRGPAYWLVVRGIRHASFTDDPVLDPGWVPEGATMDPGAALELVGDYLDAFFATHLRDEPDPLLDPRAILRVFGAERLRHRNPAAEPASVGPQRMIDLGFPWLLEDATKAEIHIVVRNHGLAQSGADLAEQLHTFWGNCTNVRVDASAPPRTSKTASSEPGCRPSRELPVLEAKSCQSSAGRCLSTNSRERSTSTSR